MTTTVSSGLISVMRSMQPWVRFAGALLFVSAVLSLLAVLDAIMGGGYLSAPQASSEELMLAVMMGVINIIFEIILGYCLIAYAIRIGYFLQSGTSADLERALNMHRQFWKSSGIYAIVFIVSMILMLGMVMMMTIAGQGLTH